MDKSFLRVAKTLGLFRGEQSDALAFLGLDFLIDVIRLMAGRREAP